MFIGVSILDLLLTDEIFGRKVMGIVGKECWQGKMQGC